MLCVVSGRWHALTHACVTPTAARILNGSFDRDELYLGLFGDPESSPPPPRQHGEDLRRMLGLGLTLQFFGIHRWVPSIADLCLELTTASGRPVKANAYVTPPGVRTSLIPHNDVQCTLIVQLQGRKRWKLWKKDVAWLPVRQWQNLHPNVQEESLGAPYLDVVLTPGDVLYVIRTSS